jgi:ADP-ribose pyrophosphatase
MELKRLSRQVVYTGKVFDVIVDQVEYPSGNKGVREIAHHPGGAVTVPAGKLTPGEDPRLAAGRELEEETGYIAGSLEHLTSIYTTPGFCDEELHIFLATQLSESPHGHNREEGEFSMTIQSMPLQEALAMVETGAINDSKTIIGLFWIDRRMKSRH